MAYCKFCGKPLQFEEAEICPSCGMRLRDPTTEEVEPKPYVEYKSPVLAAILSWLFIGMGQIYVGRVGRGLVIMLMALFCVLLIFAGGIGLVFLVILDIASIFDAYSLAKEYNEDARYED
jgi:TM2 domain-containing membrane protein YozV